MMTEKDFKLLLKLNKQMMEEVQELKELIKGNSKLTESEKFLTKKQAGDFLQVTERQINYLLAQNKLPFATKVGGRWRFPKSELERYIART